MIASFSRALAEDLQASMSDAEFNAALAQGDRIDASSTLVITASGTGSRIRRRNHGRCHRVEQPDLVMRDVPVQMKVVAPITPGAEADQPAANPRTDRPASVQAQRPQSRG